MSQLLNVPKSVKASSKVTLGITAAITFAAFGLYAGCNIITPGGTDPTPTPGSGSLTGSISLQSHIKLSGDQTMTIVYSASSSATDISAFYVPVESTDTDAPTTGSETTFKTNLSAGTNLTMSLDTSGMAQALYRIGLNLVGGGQTLKVMSTGTVQITNLPEPAFELPNQNLVVVPGSYIPVRVALGDPENAVQWRLFYIATDADTSGLPADQLGTEIKTGAANVAETNWNTAGVAYGTYRLGISSTDTGQSIAQTVLSGDTDRIVTVYTETTVTFQEDEPIEQPPTLSVTQPESDVYLLESDTTLITFEAKVFEGVAANQKISVFYDYDGTAGTDDEVFISTNLPISTKSAVFNGSLTHETKEQYVGVTVTDGVNPAVTKYAKGTISRADPANASLKVLQPSSSLPRKPGDTVNVSWHYVDLPVSAAAKVDVYMKRVDANDVEQGDEIPILASTSLSTKATSFTATSTGRFRVTVRVIFDDGETASLVTNAPAIVVVSTQPKVLWLGNLADKDSGIDGAIFEGVQFEDNAGSSFAGNEDFDKDGNDEVVIVSRYAKPEFVTADGVGIGEAYLIRGTSERYSGKYNLNSVAGPKVPGFVFTGINYDDRITTDKTDGMASVFFTADADGDYVGEIAFGFPWVFSEQLFTLDGPTLVPNMDGDAMVASCPLGDSNPQFTRGGVVIVSSRNTEVETTTYDMSGHRCPLGWVGQVFRSHVEPYPNLDREISPEPGEGKLCSGSSTWMSDRLEWRVDDCDPLIEPIIGCDFGQDGEEETLSQPNFGFIPALADPYPCNDPVMCYEGDSRGSLTELCPAHLYLEGDFDCGDNPWGDYSAQLDPSMQLCQLTYMDYLDPADPDCDPFETLAEDAMPLGFAWIDPYNVETGGGTYSYLSGFYRERFAGDSPGTGAHYTPTADADWNMILRTPTGSNNVRSLIGCRIVGREVGEAYGTSIAQSDDNLIISSPLTEGGVGYSVENYHPTGSASGMFSWFWQLPAELGIDPTDYPNRNTPPLPHQYMAGGRGHAAYTAPGSYAFGHIDVNGLNIFGDTDEAITNIVGIPDFNADSLLDIAVGAPFADVDQDGSKEGAVYILFRRAETLEDDFVLANLKLPSNASSRLGGVLIREELGSAERFGFSVAGPHVTYDADDIIDFNHDGINDVVVGNPDGNSVGGLNATGEVVIIFGNRSLTTEQNGMSVDELLADKKGARIRGTQSGSEFGLNVSIIGDIDGDGKKRVGHRGTQRHTQIRQQPQRCNGSTGYAWT